jgi:hypothetical protein
MISHVRHLYQLEERREGRGEKGEERRERREGRGEKGEERREEIKVRERKGRREKGGEGRREGGREGRREGRREERRFIPHNRVVGDERVEMNATPIEKRKIKRCILSN